MIYCQCNTKWEVRVLRGIKLFPWDFLCNISSVQFSCSVMSDSLWPHGLQHACPSPTPVAYLNSCPSSWWCHPTISSSVIPSPPTFNLPSIRVFSNESFLRIRWPRYWSFSFSINIMSLALCNIRGCKCSFHVKWW